MKKLFGFVEDSAKALYLLGLAFYYLWQEVGVPFDREVVILAFQFMLVSSPVIVGTAFWRWTRKWPKTVSWFTIAFALVSAGGFVYSLRALLIIFGEGNSPLLINVILPALVPVLSVLACIAVLKWYKDRRHQRPRA